MTPAGDAHAGALHLRCRRCGYDVVRSVETVEAEQWGERWARGELADNPWVDPGSIDPRIRELGPRR
jgi:hypothetical protein